MVSEYGDLVIEDVQRVRTLKLNRSDRLNAFDESLSTHLIEALNEGSRDDDVHVIVITGEGRGFCSGLDLSRFTDGSIFPNTRHGRLDELEWVGRLVQSIVHNDKPVIAAINGVAAGAGLSMALACDFRLMSETAELTTGYIRRALSPDAGMTYFLPRLIGQTKATELILTGRNVDAREANMLGILNAVFPADGFFDHALEFALSLAEAPPVAVTLSKRLLVSSFDNSLVPHLKQELAFLKNCFETEDVREGIQSMLEKRKPVFVGR